MEVHSIANKFMRIPGGTLMLSENKMYQALDDATAGLLKVS